MKPLMYSLMFGALILSACASAKGPPSHNPHASRKKAHRSGGPITAIRPASLLFASYNRNGDYHIDQSEFETGLATSFMAADSNKDDKLSPFELAQRRRRALGSVDAAPGSMAFDSDFNQTVTHIEFDKALRSAFQAADTDGNSMVSFEELVKIISRPSPRQSRPNGKRPQGGKGGGRHRS